MSASGSPQRETALGDRPINGEGDIKSETIPTPAEISKTSAGMNTGVSSVGSAGDALQPITANARPGPAMMTSPRSHTSTAQPPMNRAGIVPMSRVSGAGSGGGHLTSQSNQWGQQSNQYNSRPSASRYKSDMPPAGYGNYQTRPYNSHHGQDSLSKTNIYIRGLNANTTDSDLITLCQPYGLIKSTKAIIDQATNKCKGYGFVDFEKPGDAERATQGLAGIGIQAQMAKVREGSQQEQDPTNLYIANLPDYVDEHYLEGMFVPYGAIVSVRILRDPGGQSRNVGFCRMETKEMCDRVVIELNKKPLPGSREPLLIKFADSGNRRKREHRQHQAMMGYDGSMQHGHMGGQMMSQGNVGMNARYPMQQVSNQSSYLQNAGGNWGGMPMYPQVAMSPVNPAAVTSIQSSMMDPSSVLATQFGQMQLAAGQNYGMQQQSQQPYQHMYQSQAMMPPFQYEMSASPPTQLVHSLDEHYPTFPQMSSTPKPGTTE